MAARRSRKISYFSIFAYGVFIGFILLILIGLSMLSNDPYIDEDITLPEFVDKHKDEGRALSEQITEPIIIWWTGFTGQPGAYSDCGSHRCYFTVDRHYREHPQTKGFLFYGTDLRVTDLPIPRKPDHDWGLLHEESPKNNYILSHAAVLELFNHTSTFRRESSYPITMQYATSAQWLKSTKFLLPTSEKNKHLSELAPLMFTQSDCGVPSDRDHYVTMLMKEMAVDSYGSCLHNKDLPQHLQKPLEGYLHDDFYKLIAKYKFTLAMENAVCQDYITEKLWRPLMVGSVPIVYGSPAIRELLPDEHSAILVEDFSSVHELAEYLKFLNENDDEYDKYLQWKKTGITNKLLIDMLNSRDYTSALTGRGYSNFIEGFECFVCNKIHENIQREKAGEEKLKYQASVEHYGCPAPKLFDSVGKRVESDAWAYEWIETSHKAKAVRYFADRNEPINKADLYAKTSQIRHSGR